MAVKNEVPAYEMLWQKGGKSYAIDVAGQPPREITQADFEAGALKIMQAKLDVLKADKNELKLARDEAKDRADKAEAALDSALESLKTDDAAAAKATIKLARKAKRYARRDELLAKIAADQAELAALQSNQGNSMSVLAEAQAEVDKYVV